MRLRALALLAALAASSTSWAGVSGAGRCWPTLLDLTAHVCATEYPLETGSDFRTCQAYNAGGAMEIHIHVGGRAPTITYRTVGGAACDENEALADASFMAWGIGFAWLLAVGLMHLKRAASA